MKDEILKPVITGKRYNFTCKWVLNKININLCLIQEDKQMIRLKRYLNLNKHHWLSNNDNFSVACANEEKKSSFLSSVYLQIHFNILLS